MKQSTFAKRIFAFASVFTLVSYVQAPANSAPIPGFGKRNEIKSNGFKLTVNWCQVSAARSAECDVTAISLTQDYKAGFAYPILQDQSGAQYRMVPKDGSLGQYVMIAGEPYHIRFVNKDILPTTVKRVRGLVGSLGHLEFERDKSGRVSGYLC